jgi:O-methyltransferase
MKIISFYKKIKKLIKNKIYKFNGFSFEIKILENEFSLVSIDRLLNLRKHCQRFSSTNFSFVELGVAKGGCLALMKKYAGNNNKVFGFDSFQGMPDITNEDEYNQENIELKHIYNKNPKDIVNINYSGGIENVYNTFSILNIDTNNFFLIKGYFEDTLNKTENINDLNKIAILRLDSDWYDSTKLSLEKLYDKVVIGGVIIIDDYGYWYGSKKATDEFRKKNKITSPLCKTDDTEYYWIKTGETILCNLGYKYSVDKSPIFGNHTYTPIYDKLLNEFRFKFQVILEIGIGHKKLMSPLTNVNYKPGASLRMWKEYFSNAEIFGADIMKSIFFNEDRITTLYLDQSNVNSHKDLIININKNIDLIIDDGSHQEEHIINSFSNLWKTINPNGLYIIEDISINFFNRIANLNIELEFKDASCIIAYKGINSFDNLIIFKKIL